MVPTAPFDRDTALGRLGEEEFDLLVIGGGITGAGVALDAASRGLRTALVEKGDFGSGTSSKSSKMVHGGIRYLRQRELRLVYESLAERQRLLENAPHLVSPLPFLIPLFGHGGVVAKTVARSYAMALWLYDLTGGVRIGKLHRKVSRDEALSHLPLLRAQNLVAGFLYFDAQADDARLTLSILQTAALDHGATVANYVAAESLLHDGPSINGARVRPSGTDPIRVAARVVVNATGVWSDEVQALDEPGRPASLRPAKGVHLTVPRQRLPADIAAVIPVPHDRRSVFVVPWPGTQMVYVGTTDTPYDGPLDNPTCTPQDVDYLLEAVNAATSAGLTAADVTAVWAGLRPLLAPHGDKRPSQRTADLSRRHTVRTSPHGLVTVTGGKLTTYRKMAQETVDRAVQLLEEDGTRQHASWHRCATRHLRLHGAPRGGAPRHFSLRGASGKHWEEQDGARRGDDLAALPAPLRTHLWGRYGTETPGVLALAEDRQDLLQPLIEGLPYIRAEVVHAARHEMARSVDDVLMRRTRAGLQDARGAAGAARAVAELLAPELGWSVTRTSQEADAFATTTLARLEQAGAAHGAGPDLATVARRAR